MVNNTIIKHLWVLNDALVKGLKSAIVFLEKVDEFSPEKRQIVIDSLKELVSNSEKLYEHKHEPEPEPTKH